MTKPARKRNAYAAAVASPEAASNWARGFKPYHDALRKLKLPPRGKLRSARNYRRVKLVCDAMHRVRVQLEKDVQRQIASNL